MIKQITIRDVASYDHEGVTFDNLAKVNLIFGGNGTGKTTMSRVLNDVGRYPQCQLQWGGRMHDVVVIDDPISSLDYDAIEVVSLLTNELAERTRQGRDRNQGDRNFDTQYIDRRSCSSLQGIV